MAATTESVKADAAEAPLLNKRNLILGSLIYIVFYAWVRWYEGVYGWSAGLDSFAPDFASAIVTVICSIGCDSPGISLRLMALPRVRFILLMCCIFKYNETLIDATKDIAIIAK